MLLGRLSGRDDVVFGVTVSGRPAELAGVEHMVGLFINTLPLRMRLPPQQPLSELLRRTQESQSRLMAHQHIGLAEIQQAGGWASCSTRSWCSRTIRSTAAGLAAPARRAAARPGRGPRCDALSAGADRCSRASELQLRLDYRPDLFERADVEALGERLIRLLGGGCGCGPRARARCRCCRRPSATPSCGLERHRAGDARRDHAGEQFAADRRCWPRRPSARRMRWR